MSAFPAVHDRVKVLAGPHLGKLGEVYHVDESRMSPILVVGGDFRDWYRPDEVEKIPLPTVGDQVRITLGLFRGNRGTVERIDESLPSPILVAGERFAGWYEPDQVEAVPKCGCHLNDEGRGHWSACPEAEVSETEPEEISAEELRFYPLENWRRDVANTYTELGYKAWVAEQQKAARAKIRQTIQVEPVDPEMVQPWKSGNFAIVDDDLGGAIAYASTELLAEVIRDAIRERNRQ